MSDDYQTTVCLCTFNRPGNLAELLESLADQRPRVRVWVWNNGEPLSDRLRTRIDWLIESPRNCLCTPRWWLAARAETTYVVILDDDLHPAQPLSLGHLLSHCQPGRIVGPYGAIVAKSYRRHVQIYNPIFPTPVDVVKGRCQAMHTDTLRSAVGRSGVLTARANDVSYDDLAIAEDIAVCGAVAGGRRLHHLVPAGIAEDWPNLPEGAESLSRRSDHLSRRDRVFSRAFVPC